MCKRKFILPKSTIPGRRWQYVCLRESGNYKGTGSCSRFCSPDCHEFEMMAQVRKHQKKLEFLRLEKKKLKLLKERGVKEISLRAALLNKKPKLKKPTIPQVLEKQTTETETIPSVKIKKSEKIKTETIPSVKTKKSKEKITTKQIEHFFGMKEYPIIVNHRNRKIWEDIEVFRNYYVPLVYIANPTAHVRLLETYVEAKWREIMS